MKSGTLIGAALGVGALVALIAGYALNTYVYYHRVDGLAAVAIGGRDFAVVEYRGLDNPSLPLRLRGCFRLQDPAGALAAGRPAPDAAPFAAPYWFDCWDAARIDADLDAGRAEAIVAEENAVGDVGFERVVVVYPDGLAYQWRQLIER